jgi:tryptophanyl-tRNA synthetase
VARAVTDAGSEVRHDPDGKPGVSNLLDILAACGGGEPTLDSYGALKSAVTDAVVATLEPIQHRYRELSADPAHVRGILTEGAERVAKRTADTVTRARRAIGLLD